MSIPPNLPEPAMGIPPGTPIEIIVVADAGEETARSSLYLL